MLNLQISPNPALLDLLQRHPRVQSVAEGATDVAVSWSQGEWKRSISVDRRDAPLRGIVELIDNNPMVCADEFSVPSPAATLGLIALGPLAAAGLIVERPTMLVNIETEEDELSAFLEPMGWTEGVTVAGEPTDLGGVVAATVICAVKTPDRLEDLDDLFDERYGRSFYVRHDEASEWHASLVIDKPHALYRLRVSPDEPYSLLTVQTMASRQGKCGAAQIVHALNVMCGFEESLGIA